MPKIHQNLIAKSTPLTETVNPMTVKTTKEKTLQSSLRSESFNFLFLQRKQRTIMVFSTDVLYEQLA